MAGYVGDLEGKITKVDSLPGLQSVISPSCLWPALPLVVLAFGSYFRPIIVAAINRWAGTPDQMTWEAVIVYWGCYLVNLVLFAVLLRRTLPSCQRENNCGYKNKGAPPQETVIGVSSPTSVGKLSESFDPLLGFRGLAFVMVFLGHWFMVVFPPVDLAERLREGSILWLLTSSPWAGVWVFFTLSAYLMGKGFFSRRYDLTLSRTLSFYRNRALRILPMYLSAVLLVGLLVSPTFFDITTPDSFFRFLSVFLFDARGVPPIGALWSISTEVQFYALVPFFCLVISRYIKSSRGAILVGVLIAILSCIAKYVALLGHADWHSYIYFPIVANLDCFLVGLLTAFVVQRSTMRPVSTHRYHLFAANVVVGGLYLVLSFWSARAMVPGVGGSSGLFMGAAPAMTAVLAALAIFLYERLRTANQWEYSPAGWFGRAVSRGASYLGLLTYALYVWHEPILLSLRHMAGSSLSLEQTIFFFVPGAIAVLGVGLFFYRHVELPFDRMRESRVAKSA